MTGPARSRGRVAAGDEDQLSRLASFRAAHPEAVNGDGGFGTWQALIPEENGETVVTRHRLGELMDRLAEIFPDLQ